MATKPGTSPPRGTRDILPPEVELRDAATQRILAVYRSFGFRRIETPALESLRLLAGSDGGENEKLIFKVLKRGEDLEAAVRTGGDLADLGLRFDLTVPLARYYAEHHARLPDPLKAIQIGPVWRAERPQKGRYRQFTQCDIDTLGLASDVVEVELILATCEALAGLGLDGPDGTHQRPPDPEPDRAALRLRRGPPGRLLHHVRQAGQARRRGRARRAAPERARARGDRAVRAAAAHAAERRGVAAASCEPPSGGGEAGEAFDSLAWIIRTANAEMPAGTRVRFDPTLVRGMGYYTGTIFEIASPAFPSSIAGGGRYDRLVGRLLGRDVPACGFSIGFERLIMILSERGEAGASGAVEPATAARRIALLVDGGGDLTAALAAARALRVEGHLVSLELKRKNVGKQLGDLATHGFWGYATGEAPGPASVKPLTGPRERP